MKADTKAKALIQQKALNKQSVILEKVAMKGMTRREEAEAEYKDDSENVEEEEEEAKAVTYEVLCQLLLLIDFVPDQVGCLPVLTQLLMNPLQYPQSAVIEAKKTYCDLCCDNLIDNPPHRR